MPLAASPHRARARLVVAAAAAVAALFALPGAASAQTPGSIVIEEFRFHGPAGDNDEFIELYNRSNQPINLDPAGNGRYFLQYWSPTANNGSEGYVDLGLRNVISPKEHLLVANVPGTAFCSDAANGYSLNEVACADIEFDNSGEDVPFDGSVILYYNNQAATPAFTTIDQVGFNSLEPDFGEGTLLDPVGALTNHDYSWMRAYDTAGPGTDTQNNKADFDMVGTTGADYPVSFGAAPAVGEILGGPGPQACDTPIWNGVGLSSSMYDTAVGGNSEPNRKFLPNNTNPTSVLFRRKITNGTGTAIDDLRLRITGISTRNSDPIPGAPQTAILTLDNASGSGLPGVQATTVQAPSIAPFAGYNSTVNVPLPGGSLAPGSSVSFEVKFNIEQAGVYRFGYAAETNLGTGATGLGPLCS